MPKQKKITIIIKIAAVVCQIQKIQVMAMPCGIWIQNIKNLIKRVYYDDFIEYLLTIKGQKCQTLATEIWHFWTRSNVKNSRLQNISIQD